MYLFGWILFFGVLGAFLWNIRKEDSEEGHLFDDQDLHDWIEERRIDP